MKELLSEPIRHGVLVALPVVLCLVLSGCTLFGLGAAAGAAVGGCALLDENQDDRVTQEELTRGVFDAWDADTDGQLTQAEFDAGVNRGTSFDAVSGDFDAWDGDGDGSLSEAEFNSGIMDNQSTLAAVDDGCDDLGL